MNLPLDHTALQSLQADTDRVTDLVRPTRDEAEAAVRTLIRWAGGL
jgi:hypothetical protein